MIEHYDKIGIGYSNQRKSDRNIFLQICQGLAESSSVLNVGAGAGSYEPTHVPTIAIEPSFQMIRQRNNKANVVQGSAEALPFSDIIFESTLAVLTIHHWSNLDQGLQECARVSQRKVVILTWDPDSPDFWLTRHYFPELLEFDRRIFPSMEKLRQSLGKIKVTNIPIPANCADGFLGAYWRRPEAYLQANVRSGMSSFSCIPALSERLVQLHKDLESGMWHRTHRNLLAKESLDLGYRLVTAMVQ